MAKDIAELEDRMRFRDLLLQVERFLKYAPSGTAPEVLSTEAREFERRLDAFGEGFSPSKVHKAQERLRKLYENNEMKP